MVSFSADTSTEKGDRKRTKMEILFENEERIVCIKEPGLLSEEAPGKASLPALLQAHTGGAVFPVHRLDRETGGVMVYAKTAREAARLSRLVQENRLEKEYLAVVCHNPAEPEGVWEDLLFHDRAKNKTYVVRRERRGVKKAKLAYRVLAEKDGYTLVQVRLYTGRTHQIRAQFSARGCPLLGDRHYGGAAAPGLGLWAFRLALPGGTYTSPPPPGGFWAPFRDIPLPPPLSL